MPTPDGLSASRTSFPRYANETGALRASERRRTSCRACRVPSPPWIAIFLALEISADGLVERIVGRTHDRPVGEHRVAQHGMVDRLRRDIARHDHHADAALEDGRLQCELGDPRHLAG